MAIISKNIENLKPDKEYVVTVRAKNPDVNVVSNYSDSIRFRTPTDSTIPNAPTNLELAVSFFNVLFKYDVSIDNDVLEYEYELYQESQVELVSSIYQPKSGETPHRTGFVSGNVFLVSVGTNSSTTSATTVTNPVKYYGRVRTIDTSNNISDWTQIVESGDTPLIDEQFIGSLTAAKITAGEIGAHTIQLNGSNSIIQSSNYVPGTSGWSIFGDGSAEFLNVTIGGDSTIENMPGGGDFETVATNFNNRNDRISTTPNDPTNVAFDTDVANLDASIDLVLNWDFTVDATPTDAQNIDGFVLYLRTSSSTNASDITTADLNNNIYEIYLTAEKRSHTFAGISSSYFYRAAVRAYRMVDDDIDSDGIIYSSLVNTSERAATTPLIGGTGIKIGSGKIYIGAGNYGNADTGFYVDSTGDLSLGEKFVWDYSAGTLSITGQISAQTFNILNSSSEIVSELGVGSLLFPGSSSITGTALKFNHLDSTVVDSQIVWSQRTSDNGTEYLQIQGPDSSSWSYTQAFMGLTKTTTSSSISLWSGQTSIINSYNHSTNAGSIQISNNNGTISIDSTNGQLQLNSVNSTAILSADNGLSLYSFNTWSGYSWGNMTLTSLGSITLDSGTSLTLNSGTDGNITLYGGNGGDVNITARTNKFSGGSMNLTVASSKTGRLYGTWRAENNFTVAGTLSAGTFSPTSLSVGTGGISSTGPISTSSASAISSTYGYYVSTYGQIFDSGSNLFLRSYIYGSAVKVLFSTDGCQIRSGLDSAYYAIRASAFNVSSSIEVKTDVQEARSSLDTLLNTTIYEWKYTSEKEDRPDDERITHVFPVAEDMPDYLLSSSLDDEKIIDIRDITGFLWKASQESYQDLTNKITALEQRLQALES